VLEGMEIGVKVKVSFHPNLHLLSLSKFLFSFFLCLHMGVWRCGFCFIWSPAMILAQHAFLISLQQEKNDKRKDGDGIGRKLVRECWVDTIQKTRLVSSSRKSEFIDYAFAFFSTFSSSFLKCQGGSSSPVPPPHPGNASLRAHSNFSFSESQFACLLVQFEVLNFCYVLVYFWTNLFSPHFQKLFHLNSLEKCENSKKVMKEGIGRCEKWESLPLASGSIQFGRVL